MESFAAVAWMAHNPSAKEFPTPIRRDKYTDAVKSETSHQSSENDADDLCTGIDELSLQRKSNNAETCSDSGEHYIMLDEYYDDSAASCSSCTSGSSCSSSFTLESDSDDSYSESDDSSSSGSEDDSDNSSDNEDGAHRLLLKKDNCEKYR